MKEEAASLATRAVSAFQSGDHELAAKLCRQAISAMAATADYRNLLVVLGNLATSVPDVDEKRRLLAQTVWLSIALEVPNSLLYIVALFQALPEGSPLEEPLAAAGLMESRRGAEADPAHAEMALKLAAVLARRKRVVPAETDRFLHEFVTNAPKVAAGLLHALDDAVGEAWEFDRGPLIKRVGKRLSHKSHSVH